jgi:hypothetical protein
VDAAVAVRRRDGLRRAVGAVGVVSVFFVARGIQFLGLLD